MDEQKEPIAPRVTSDNFALVLSSVVAVQRDVGELIADRRTSDANIEKIFEDVEDVKKNVGILMRRMRWLLGGVYIGGAILAWIGKGLLAVVVPLLQQRLGLPH